MDTQTVAAWVAFAIALFAVVVALAQVTQQYLSTASGMRMCDTLVWGPMPGSPGRRKWIWHQLRFKVVFEMPNIYIPASYWWTSGNARVFDPARVTCLENSFGRKDKPSSDLEVERCSEACWVSFARQIHRVCPAAVGIHLAMGDVDRIPSDIGVVPMQISLRDAIALGLMIGMDLSNASGNSLEMSGASGSFTSSQHPLLGTVVHFSAYGSAARSGHRGLLNGDLSKSWLQRLQGIASIADQQYTEARRDYFENLTRDWRSMRKRLLTDGRGKDGGNGRMKNKEILLTFIDKDRKQHLVPVNKCGTWEDVVTTLANEGIAELPYIIIGLNNKKVRPRDWKPLHKVLAQGNINIIFTIVAGDYAGTDLPDNQEAAGGDSTMLDILIQRGHKHDTMPEAEAKKESEPAQSTSDSHAEQEGDVGFAGREDSPARNGASQYRNPYVEPEEAMPLVIYRNGTPSPPTPPPPPPSEPSTSPRSRHRRRHRHVDSFFADDDRLDDERRQHYPTAYSPSYRPDPTKLTFFWASQVDVELGPWATPWQGGLFREAFESLNMMVEVALVAMASCAAIGKTDGEKLEHAGEISFVDFPGDIVLNEIFTKLRRNEHTWPPYAVNGKGGISEPQSHRAIRFAAFPDDEPLPPISLVRSVREFQYEHDKSTPPTLSRDRTVELASLDWWLSHAGASNSILTSKDNLLINTPAIVEEMFRRFQGGFSRAVEAQWSPDGGQPQVNQMAEDINEWLERTIEQSADRYFLLVGFLRAVKVLQCVHEGPDTRFATRLFKEDILVYLV